VLGRVRCWRQRNEHLHQPDGPGAAGDTAPAGAQDGGDAGGDKSGHAQPPDLDPADPTLVKALARAFRYQRMLNEEHYASITEMAEAERLDRGYMGRLLQLTLLAPSLVEAVLDERQPEQLNLPALLKPLPMKWEQQGEAGVFLIIPGCEMGARIALVDPGAEDKKAA
jgi:hypothetical protein